MNVIELNKLISKKYATIEDIKIFTGADDYYCHQTFNHLKELSIYKGYLRKKNKVYMNVFIEFFNIDAEKVKETVRQINQLYNVSKIGVIRFNET